MGISKSNLSWKTYISLLGNHTIAVAKVKEEYNSLRKSLPNVIRDINAVVKDGHIMVGERVDLDFYLGGDYKVNENYYFFGTVRNSRISNVFDHVFIYFNCFCFWPWE